VYFFEPKKSTKKGTYCKISLKKSYEKKVGENCGGGRMFKYGFSKQ
jgi:hypothetical protein